MMYINLDPNDTKTQWNTSYHEILQVNPALWGRHHEAAVPTAIAVFPRWFHLGALCHICKIFVPF